MSPDFFFPKLIMFFRVQDRGGSVIFPKFPPLINHRAKADLSAFLPLPPLISLPKSKSHFFSFRVSDY